MFTPPPPRYYEARVHGSDTTAVPSRPGYRSTVAAARVQAFLRGRAVVVLETATGIPLAVVTPRGDVCQASRYRA